MTDWLNDVPTLPMHRALALADKRWLRPLLLAAAPGASELTFTNLFTWAGTHPVELSRLGETLLMWRGPADRGMLLAPIGPALDRVGIERAWRWSVDLGGAPEFGRVPRATADALLAAHDGLAAVEDRDSADYVYRRADLAELPGRKYAAKRNLVKQFDREARAHYEDLRGDLVARCLRVQQEWCDNRGCSEHPDLDAEDRAVLRTLEHWDELDVRGGALVLEEAAAPVIAFAVGEALAADTAVIHFEKGSTRFPGTYQKIAQEFCARRLGEFEFVNREQDLGLEGLRKAKLSYHPHHLLDKFTVRAR